MTKQEYEGVAFTAGIKDGWQVSVTERSNSSADAVARLEATIALMAKEGYEPFVSYYNRASENMPAQVDTPVTPTQPEPFPVDTQAAVSVVAQAQQLGGVTPQESASIASGLLEIPEGHLYLGVKPGKLEEIGENSSYQVLAETYSYDGTWVNFFNKSGGLSIAGSYYANPTGMKIFQEMFHWQPQLVEKAQLPGGNVLLYILGVNSKGTVYQNIKSVEPA